MNVSEQVGFLDDAIKGHVKVQLMEQDKVVQEVEGDNFIGRDLYNWLLSCLVSTFVDFFSDFPQNQGGSTGVAPFPCTIDQFVLTNNVEPVIQNALTIPGTVISGGYVTRQPYSGSDRGTVNNIESKFDLFTKKARLVMDFSTSAANGTFQTLGFRRSSLFRRGFNVYQIDYSYPFRDFCFYDDKLYRRIGPTQVEELDLSTRTIRTISFASTIYNRISVHENFLYLHLADNTASNRKVYSVDLSNPSSSVVEVGTLTTAPSNYTSSYAQFWADADYFYTTGQHNSNALYIAAYNKTTLSVVKDSYIVLDWSDYSFNQTSTKYYSGGKTYVENYNGAIICLTDFVQSTTVPSFTTTPFSSLGSQSSTVVAIKNDGSRIGVTSVQCPHFLSASASGTGRGQEQSRYYLAELEAFSMANLGTCVVLPTPVTKTSEQTMKITYELTFNFK